MKTLTNFFLDLKTLVKTETIHKIEHSGKRPGEGRPLEGRKRPGGEARTQGLRSRDMRLGNGERQGREAKVWRKLKPRFRDIRLGIREQLKTRPNRED
jgi:hypothetical protein